MRMKSIDIPEMNIAVHLPAEFELAEPWPMCPVCWTAVPDDDAMRICPVCGADVIEAGGWR